MVITDDGRCLCNKRELAAVLGVSERTLTEWQEQGLPIEVIGGRGLDNQYDTAKVIEWRIQRALAGQSRESGKERLERLQAEELEMRIAERAGRLVPAADVERRWTEAITAARTDLLTLGDRLKARLDGTYRVNVDPTIIDTEVLSCLNKLALRGPELAGAEDAEHKEEEAEA